MALWTAWLLTPCRNCCRSRSLASIAPTRPGACGLGRCWPFAMLRSGVPVTLAICSCSLALSCDDISPELFRLRAELAPRDPGRESKSAELLREWLCNIPYELRRFGPELGVVAWKPLRVLAEEVRACAALCCTYCSALKP